jgi:mono/diheme cytochrome c family protein
MGQTFKLTLLLFLISVSMALSCGNAESSDAIYKPSPEGELIFKKQCALCHGLTGNKQLSGAKKLTESKLPMNEIEALVTNGMRQMPSFKEILTIEEIKLVSDYAYQFRESK